jgi:hypothetical protein
VSPIRPPILRHRLLEGLTPTLIILFPLAISVPHQFTNGVHVIDLHARARLPTLLPSMRAHMLLSAIGRDIGKPFLVEDTEVVRVREDYHVCDEEDAEEDEGGNFEATGEERSGAHVTSIVGWSRLSLLLAIASEHLVEWFSLCN